MGKKRSPGVQLIVDEYVEKLKHYCRVEDVRIKSNPKNARFVELITHMVSENLANVHHMCLLCAVLMDEYNILNSAGLSIASVLDM